MAGHRRCRRGFFASGLRRTTLRGFFRRLPSHSSQHRSVPLPLQIPVKPLLASLLLACASLSSAAHGEPVICGSVADEFTARAAGLERQWILQIPSGVGSWRLEQVTVGGGLVVAQTGDGGVHAIQAAREGDGLPPGTLLWSQQLGAGGGPAGAAGIGPQVVTVAHDLAISAIDRRTGTVAWEKQLGKLPGAAAVPSTSSRATVKVLPAPSAERSSMR